MKIINFITIFLFLQRFQFQSDGLIEEKSNMTEEESQMEQMNGKKIKIIFIYL